MNWKVEANSFAADGYLPLTRLNPNLIWSDLICSWSCSAPITPAAPSVLQAAWSRSNTISRHLFECSLAPGGSLVGWNRGVRGPLTTLQRCFAKASLTKSSFTQMDDVISGAKLLLLILYGFSFSFFLLPLRTMTHNCLLLVKGSPGDEYGAASFFIFLHCRLFKWQRRKPCVKRLCRRSDDSRLMEGFCDSATLHRWSFCI